MVKWIMDHAWDGMANMKDCEINKLNKVSPFPPWCRAARSPRRRRARCRTFPRHCGKYELCRLEPKITVRIPQATVACSTSGSSRSWVGIYHGSWKLTSLLSRSVAAISQNSHPRLAHSHLESATLLSRAKFLFLFLSVIFILILILFLFYFISIFISIFILALFLFLFPHSLSVPFCLILVCKSSCGAAFLKTRVRFL